MRRELQEQIKECSTELSDIDLKIAALPPLDKTRLYLTQYSLMKACGTVEFVYRAIVADFFDQSTLVQIHTYIDKTVRNGSMSATYDNMSGLLGKFDDTWKNNFRTTVQQRADGQKLISSAKSLVANRHLFAHGQPPTATFNDIFQYYADTLELIVILDSVVQ